MPKPSLKMPSPTARELLLATALLVPAPALAKHGSDAAGAAATAFAFFAVFALLIEAAVFRRTLGVGSLRALGWSVLCHLASLPVVVASGLALWIIRVEAHFIAVTAFLALLYGISWLVHWPVAAALVKRGTQERRMSPRGATLVASALCLAVTGAIVVAAMPGPGGTPRAKVREALAEMAVPEREITASVASGKGYPAPRSVPVAPDGALQSLKIGTEGRIEGVLRNEREQDLHAKAIVMEPRVEQGRVDRWICHTDADLIMAARFLPSRCRQSREDVERVERSGYRVGEPVSGSPPAGWPVRR